MAKKKTKTTKKKTTGKKKAASKKRGVSVTFEKRHVALIEALGRAYGCVSKNGAVEHSAVLREVFDRFGHKLLRIAHPRATSDEEE